eukprot:TRINITY_DN16139_c0_g1_i1.p3 TRINITY_DN16139_c0_g1~~TRINITY_DN16139_c0_g1_i1.p3  ORF type:complete len:120 (+),score=15.27 TRINITY_DN16139_c0_g1_i1:921-1280(+)
MEKCSRLNRRNVLLTLGLTKIFDYEGLIVSAKACYDPSKDVQVDGSYGKAMKSAWFLLDGNKETTLDTLNSAAKPTGSEVELNKAKDAVVQGPHPANWIMANNVFVKSKTIRAALLEYG